MDTKTLESFRPVSSLYVCEKILERLMFNKIFNFSIENKLILSNQSGFKPDDSCINQPLSITREMYESFDMELKVRSVRLDISKAFHKVWHDGIIYKLTQNGVSENLLNFSEGFLKGRKQRIVLSG